MLKKDTFFIKYRIEMVIIFKKSIIKQKTACLYLNFKEKNQLAFLIIHKCWIKNKIIKTVATC